jgi:glycosyltransferase involved in cell wall biosynthesis
MTKDIFPGRIGIQQRVIPAYRALFLDKLAKACQGGLSIFAGRPLPKEGIESVEGLHTAQFVHAKNKNFLDPSSSLYMCWQNGFIQWLEEWQPDILIVEANPRYPTTRQAIVWMHKNKRKVIGWGLGAPPLLGLLASLRRRERLRLLNSLDGIIAYSRQGAEQYLKLGLSPEKVYIAFNAADPAPKFPLPIRPNQYTKGKASILFIGRLQSRKRIDLLLQACSALPKESQPQLVIVGDGPAREEFERIAIQVYPSAKFVGGIHGAELEPYFSDSDLFVLPGTGGLAIQQAMAHGLPVIVAHGDGTQDDMVRSENGWQVPPNDIVALTHTLNQALSDPAELRRKGKNSYRIVAEEINIEKMVEVFLQAANEANDQST